MKCNLWRGNFWSANWEQVNNKWLLDRDLQETYNDDSPMTVRVKCCGVFVSNPLRSICYVIAALAKATLLFLAPFFKTLYILVEAFVYGYTKVDLLRRFKEEFQGWPQNINAALSSPWLTLYHGVLIEVGAFVGLFDPFRGRKIVAHLEKEWSACDHLLAKMAIMAPCFQPRVVRGADTEGNHVIFSG